MVFFKVSRVSLPPPRNNSAVTFCNHLFQSQLNSTITRLAGRIAVPSPPTLAPPTLAPPTLAPPTLAPPTLVPLTLAPPTLAPPTLAPPTLAPPTLAPPTLTSSAETL